MTDKPQPEPPPCEGHGETMLFFDGGSRENSGPGGVGAVLVRVGVYRIGTSLAWAGSASFANPEPTNNVAEYHGLI